jgi:hypothetical protein
MTITDMRALAALAADFPGWHVWRSRDGRGRDDGWNATRRRKPGCVSRVAADGPGALRGLLEQQCAAEAGQAA